MIFKGSAGICLFFHRNLSDYMYLTKDLECVQKRALTIISHEQSYEQCLDFLGRKTLYDQTSILIHWNI